jgi:hypothetical protein
VKSGSGGGDPSYGYNPHSGIQPVLVQAENFAKSSPYAIADNRMTYSSCRNNSQPRSLLTRPKQYPQSEVLSGPRFSIFFDESEFGSSS